jgi:C-terminal processing protease CtpA/Prc
LFKEAFEHDMSGMELSTTGANYEKLIISRIEPGSAADNSGLKTGDRILAINFKNTSLLDLEDVTTLLRSKDGRNLIIEVLSPDSEETKLIMLTLKKRI